MTPKQQRDLNHWRALGSKTPWAYGWKDFHKREQPLVQRWCAPSLERDQYRHGWEEAAALEAACRTQVPA